MKIASLDSYLRDISQQRVEAFDELTEAWAAGVYTNAEHDLLMDEIRKDFDEGLHTNIWYAFRDLMFEPVIPARLKLGSHLRWFPELAQTGGAA